MVNPKPRMVAPEFIPMPERGSQAVNINTAPDKRGAFTMGCTLDPGYIENSCIPSSSWASLLE
jgi:hypothetical protein